MGSGSSFQRQQDGNIHHSASGKALLPVLPWRHLSLAGKASQNQGTPGQVWTGLSLSKCSQPPVPVGVDPPDPFSPLSLACHTRGVLCWQIP